MQGKVALWPNSKTRNSLSKGKKSAKPCRSVLPIATEARIPCLRRYQAYRTPFILNPAVEANRRAEARLETGHSAVPAKAGHPW
jgi:hypothetical protein